MGNEIKHFELYFSDGKEIEFNYEDFITFPIESERKQSYKIKDMIVEGTFEFVTEKQLLRTPDIEICIIPGQPIITLPGRWINE